MTMTLRVPTIRYAPVGEGYARRKDSLAGLRVGFLDGWGDQEGGMYPTMVAIEQALTESCGIGGTLWQMKPAIVTEVPEQMLRRFAEQVDVVVNGEGLCGSCTAATVLDAIKLESLGKPTITIVQDRFEKSALLNAKAGGLPELRFLVEPAPGDGHIQHDIHALVTENLSEIVAALTVNVD